MELTATFDSSQFEGVMASKFVGLAERVQKVMAAQLYDIVLSNFGAAGVDRPSDWAPLSKAYAQKVGRPFATLRVSGAMAAAVKSTNDSEVSRVSLSKNDCAYALAHHFGESANNLPARRVFPIYEDGRVTQFTHDAVMAAAVEEIQESLK